MGNGSFRFSARRGGCRRIALGYRQFRNLLLPVRRANGNVGQYLDGSGNIVAAYEYSPFGVIVSKSGAKQDDFNFRFSTKFFDNLTNLYYYGFRYYSPRFARWLNRDPIGKQGGINLYGMVENNAVNKWDYLGLRTVYIVYYLSPPTGKRLVTPSVKSNLKLLINIGLNAGLTNDKIAVLFYDRAPRSGELGLIRAIKYDPKYFFANFRQNTKGNCVLGYGIEVNQRSGRSTSPLGLASSQSFSLYSRSFDRQYLYLNLNKIPYNKSWVVANVMAHESLFHTLGGYSDSITKFTYLARTGGRNIDSYAMTRELVRQRGLVPAYLVDAIKNLLEVK